MWGNYLTVGLRALSRSRMYAFINIFGLAVALAACIMLLLYFRYETSYDQWLPDGERVFQVQSINQTDDNPQRRPQQASHGVITESLAKDFPQIEAIARADTERSVLLIDGEPQFMPTVAADANLFTILQLPFLRGDPRTALIRSESLVLSRAQAIRLFGGIDVVGRTVTGFRRGERYERRVTGVFEDVPANSHIVMEAVRPIANEDREACGWGCVNGYVYLKLRPGADAESVNAGLAAWERRNIPVRVVGDSETSEGALFDWRLVNVRDVHLSGADGEPGRPGNDHRTIYTFAIVALLILGMATVNFVNLATARASQRAREVVLRKVLGARRKQLITQFLGESLLVTGIAMLFALAFAELALPWFSGFLGVPLDLRYAGPNGALMPLLGLWLVVGLAGGLYPAFRLSGFRPGEVLKANQSTAEASGAGRLRNVLVVAQFAVSIGLIVCTIVVYAQTSFARQTDIGFDRNGVLQVGNLDRAAIIPVYDALIREIERIPGVEAVGASAIRIAGNQTLNVSVRQAGNPEPMVIGFYSMNPGYARAAGLRLLAGRPLSRQFANDNAFTPYLDEAEQQAAARALALRGINVVLNESAVRRLGYDSPAAAVGGQFTLNAFGEEIGLVSATIVGVVADSRFRSLREPVEPAIFYDRGIYAELLIRYASADPEAIREAVGRVWRRLGETIPYEASFVDANLANLYAADTARGRAFAAFTMLAVIIACLGLFGLAAFTAERRTREIGIRKVFGARTQDIVRLLVWQFTRPVVIANLIAWPVAWWAMREWLNTFDARIDLGVGPFLIAGLLALAIAIGTVAGHAFRVARANPIYALRYE